MYLFGVYLVYDFYCKIIYTKNVLESISTISFKQYIRELTVKSYEEKIHFYGEIIFNIVLNKTTDAEGPCFRLLLGEKEIGRFTIDYLNSTNINRSVIVNYTIDGNELNESIYLIIEINIPVVYIEYKFFLTSIANILGSLLFRDVFTYEYLDNSVLLKIPVNSEYYIEMPIRVILLNENSNELFSSNFEDFNTTKYSELEIQIDKDVFIETKNICIESYGTMIICLKKQ